jgi:hypothetical protein
LYFFGVVFNFVCVCVLVVYVCFVHIRFLFLGQLILQQVFIFYVRIMAKSRNDRTVVHMKSPLLDEMTRRGGGDSSSKRNSSNNQFLLKTIASSFLSKDTTVMEYDLGQATSMQSGIIISMALMWFFHFQLEQVQPLLIALINNTLQLFFNPLFQVYVLGRNLQRPFVTPTPAWLAQQQQQQEEEEANGQQNRKATETTTSSSSLSSSATDEYEVEVIKLEEVEEEVLLEDDDEAENDNDDDNDDDDDDEEEKVGANDDDEDDDDDDENEDTD